MPQATEHLFDGELPAQVGIVDRSATGTGPPPAGNDRLGGAFRPVDRSGRVVRADKQGAIPAHLAPILERVGITTSLWTDLVTQFDRLFGRVVGRADRVAARAAGAGRRWYRGQARCAEAFG